MTKLRARPASRTRTVEVDVECDGDHCEDHDTFTCPLRQNTDESVTAALTSAWRQVHPLGDPEHMASWKRSPDEPWVTLAQLGVGGGV